MSQLSSERLTDMFRHGEISTEVDRKPFIFTVEAFAVCIIIAILAFVFSKGNALLIFGGVMMAAVALAAAAVLFAMISDYAFVEGNKLHMSYLFRKKNVELNKIGKMSLKDDIYSVYDRAGDLIGTINAKLTGIDSLLLYLDKNGVKID